MPKTKKEVKWLEKRSWKSFRDSGMLWLVNRTLHLFGWAIAIDMSKKGKIKSVFPARCRYRGFTDRVEAQGFQKVTRYMIENVRKLLKDTQL